MAYNIVIGLEVHVELLTRSKLFCPCSSAFGAPPNSQVCPTCMGLPGSLPVLNPEAVTQALRAALALGCRVNQTSAFARKHYFYPDLPKGFQITQHERPLAEGGKVEIGSAAVDILRLHIEEDSGKLIHADDGTLVDYNRSGVPLAEIVTAPCLSSPAQARAFLETLKQVMEYTGVSDCKMEEGSLRCDANISLQSKGAGPGARTEIKNLNSFRAVERALAFEVNRQGKILTQGGEVLTQTLRWDEAANCTMPMRSKEQVLDYRYFPEPDLPPLFIDEKTIEQVTNSLPELPLAKIARFICQYRISESDAEQLSRFKAMADWFELTVAAGAVPAQAVKWLNGEVSRLLNSRQCKVERLPFAPVDLADLIGLSFQGVVSESAAKKVLAQMFAGGGKPKEIISQLGLAQISDPEELEALAEQIIVHNQEAVRDFQQGRDQALKALMGQGMKLSKGKANPALLHKIMLQRLGEKD